MMTVAGVNIDAGRSGCGVRRSQRKNAASTRTPRARRIGTYGVGQPTIVAWFQATLKRTSPATPSTAPTKSKVWLRGMSSALSDGMISTAATPNNMAAIPCDQNVHGHHASCPRKSPNQSSQCRSKRCTHPESRKDQVLPLSVRVAPAQYRDSIWEQDCWSNASQCLTDAKHHDPTAARGGG